MFSGHAVLAQNNSAADLIAKPASFVGFLTAYQLSPDKAFAQSGSRSSLGNLVVPDANSIQNDLLNAQSRGSAAYQNNIRQREQAAGKGCVSKTNLFLRDIPLDSVFPIVIGGLGDFGKGKEDNKTNAAAFGGDASTGDEGYFGYTRPVGGKEAWYGLWSDVGLYIGFWEPLAIAESVEQAFCFPGSELMSNVLKTFGEASDNIFNRYSAPDGGDGHGAGFLYSHWYMTPEMTLLFGALSDIGIRCATTGITNVFGNLAEGAKGAPVVYLSELDPSWENDSLAILNNVDSQNPYHPLYHVATAVLPLLSEPLCKVDCQSANGQGKESDDLQDYAKNGLLYRHCAGCQGYLYPLSGHTKLRGRNAAHLIVQRMMTKLSLWNLWGRLETASGKPAMCKACAGPSGQDRLGETYKYKEGPFYGFLKKSDYKLMMLSPQNEKDRPCVDDANTSDKGRCSERRYFVPLGRSMDAREKDLLMRKTDNVSNSGAGASTGTGSSSSSGGVNTAQVAACLAASVADKQGGQNSGQINTGTSTTTSSTRIVDTTEPAVPPEWIQHGPPTGTQFYTDTGRYIASYDRWHTIRVTLTNVFGAKHEPRWILAGLDSEDKEFSHLNPPIASGTILYAVVPGRAGFPGQEGGRSPAYVWTSGTQPQPYMLGSRHADTPVTQTNTFAQVSGDPGKSVEQIVTALATCTGVDLAVVAKELLSRFSAKLEEAAERAGEDSILHGAADATKIVQSWLATIAPYVGLVKATGGVNQTNVGRSQAQSPQSAATEMQDQKTTTEQNMKVEFLRPNFAFAVTRKRNCCDPLAPFPIDHATGNQNDSHDIGAKSIMMSTGLVTLVFNNCQFFNPAAISMYIVESAAYAVAPVGDPPKFNWSFLDRYSSSLVPHCLLSLTRSCSSEAKTLITDRVPFDSLINFTRKNIELMESVR